MKIYLIEYESFDGDCTYSKPMKAFTKEKDAEEYVSLCMDECKRIHAEVDAHDLKYKEELSRLNERLRYLIMNRERKISLDKCPEADRRNTIIREERSIFKSHKYDEDFFSLEEEYIYNITELEID